MKLRLKKKRLFLLTIKKKIETIKEFLDKKEGAYFYSLAHFINPKKFQEIAFKLQDVERYEVIVSLGFSIQLFL